MVGLEIKMVKLMITLRSVVSRRSSPALISIALASKTFLGNCWIFCICDHPHRNFKAKTRKKKNKGEAKVAKSNRSCLLR